MNSYIDNEKQVDAKSFTTDNYADVVAAKRPLVCTVFNSFLSGYQEGTLYFVDEYNFLHSGVTVGSDNVPTEINRMRDGKYEYIWAPEVPKANTKQKLSPLSQAEKELFESIENEAEYRCEPWEKDNSKFIPPSNIEFKDISS